MIGQTVARLRTLVVLTLLPLAGPRTATAQTVPSFDGIGLAATQTIYVQDGTGAETKGRLLQVGEKSLLLLLDDGARREIPTTDIVRIQRRGDPLKNGALIGAALGTLAGAAMAGDASISSGGRVALVGVGALVYAAIGAAIDAAIPGRTTLFQRSGKRAPVRVTTQAAPRGVALTVGLAF